MKTYDKQNAATVTASAVGTCSASLPDDFTMEISDNDFFRLGVAKTKSIEQSWIDVRLELHRRGYTVHEWTDQVRMVRCARCFKPNTKV